MSDTLWFKDAIIYELHVKTFRDSDADGIGDFRGLIEKLDYLQELGVSAIWLLPFYPSPLKDDGYDIQTTARLMTFAPFSMRHTTADFASLPSSLSTIPPIKTRGSKNPAARHRVRPSASSMSGATHRKNTKTPASSSKILKPPTGRGIRSRKHITGIAFIRISPI